MAAPQQPPPPQGAAPAEGGGDLQGQFTDLVKTLDQGLGVFINVLEKGGAPDGALQQAAALQSGFQELVSALMGGEGQEAEQGQQAASQPMPEHGGRGQAVPMGPQVRQ